MSEPAPIIRSLTDAPPLLSCRVKIPQHVVYRSFPAETVVLNLQTGRYHGLNATAGKMLDVVKESASVQTAAGSLAAAFGQPQDVIERDLCNLISSLLERGLVETEPAAEA